MPVSKLGKCDDTTLFKGGGTRGRLHQESRRVRDPEASS
jgi:hypothetical protein